MPVTAAGGSTFGHPGRAVAPAAGGGRMVGTKEEARTTGFRLAVCMVLDARKGEDGAQLPASSDGGLERGEGSGAEPADAAAAPVTPPTPASALEGTAATARAPPFLTASAPASTHTARSAGERVRHQRARILFTTRLSGTPRVVVLIRSYAAA